MKLTSTASLAVVALMMAAATPSQALDVQVGGDAGLGVGVDLGGNGGNDGNSSGGLDVDLNAGADANVDGTSDGETRNNRLLGDLDANINSDTRIDLSSIDDDDSIDFVLVSDTSADVQAALDRYNERNSARDTDLTGSISGNASLMSRLQAEGHDADDVVAVTGNADGSFIVWLDSDE